jgi:integrase
MKGKPDLALLAILVACGVCRHEAVELNVSDLQQREEHWAIVDLIGKASHVRTIPVLDWVKALTDNWLQSAGISSGRTFGKVAHHRSHFNPRRRGACPERRFALFPRITLIGRNGGTLESDASSARGHSVGKRAQREGRLARSRQYARKAGIEKLARHDLRRT